LCNRCRYLYGYWLYRPALGEGRIVATALEGMARQTEAAGNLRTNMILGCAITETTGIYALLISFLLLFAVG
jgi:F-type H+-transporting ATPase subunit c